MSSSHINSKIINLLKVDARSTISEIAAKIGVSRTTAKERIDMMLEKGIIRRFTIEMGDVDTRHSSSMAYFIVKMKKPLCQTIYQSIKDWPELVACYSLAGDMDLMILIQPESSAQVDMLREALVQMRNVESVQTTSILRQWGMPRF